MKFETSADEFSSSIYSTTTKEESTTSEESDCLGDEVMGLILTEPNMVDPPNIPRVEESKLAKILAKDLTEEEKQAYLTMLEDFPRLFIKGHDQITGVTVVQHHINLKEGIEDSKWVSHLVVTPKKNGKWQVCVDYTSLNVATKRDHFPLPFHNDILNEVARYERVMPFGLTNARATFQRFVTHVFQPFFGKSIRVFIDDFCIYSLHALQIEKVHEGLSRLQSMGGRLNIDKCHIGEAQVTLLGHVVFARGIEADPGKIHALTTLASPTSPKELVSFIQKVRYLSRFIHLLSQVVLPLQQLTHSNTFSWSEENEQQFREVKEILTSLPTPPKWEETFYVNPSVGAEKDDALVEHMVMTLMFPIRKFRSYLLPRKFVILTLEENFPLVLQHMDVSACISKWLVRLQEFEYTVQVENSTRASLVGLLTHKCYEKKLKVKPAMVKAKEEVSKLGEAQSLYFDGTYKREVDKAAVGVVIYDEEGKKVSCKGLMLENVHSDNEAEYATLSLGLEW
ncbi:hypothetical protein L7F22_011663 [Adiantum nelumboides]|nr:hypothetical protein [Adiantum nelumboides]